MSWSIGETKQRLCMQLFTNKSIYTAMAKGTSIEGKLDLQYEKLILAYRNYVSAETTVYLKPTKSNITTNIYISNNKVVGVDRRDYYMENYQRNCANLKSAKESSARDLIALLDEIDKTLNSVPKIKKYREENPPPPIQSTTTTPSSQSTTTSGGCYVATCVYGSYDCPQVWTLRRYRDETLGSTWYGRAFIRTYYAVSPTLVKWFGDTEWFKSMWKGKLDRMVAKLQANGVEDTPYEDKNW